MGTLLTGQQGNPALCPDRRAFFFFNFFESQPANEQIPRGTEPKKYGETRYGSHVTMSECMIKTRRIYENLMLDQEYMSCLDRQGAKTKDKVRM